MTSLVNAGTSGHDVAVLDSPTVLSASELGQGAAVVSGRRGKASTIRRGGGAGITTQGAFTMSMRFQGNFEEAMEGELEGFLQVSEGANAQALRSCRRDRAELRSIQQSYSQFQTNMKGDLGGGQTATGLQHGLDRLLAPEGPNGDNRVGEASKAERAPKFASKKKSNNSAARPPAGPSPGLNAKATPGSSKFVSAALAATKDAKNVGCAVLQSAKMVSLEEKVNKREMENHELKSKVKTLTAKKNGDASRPPKKPATPIKPAKWPTVADSQSPSSDQVFNIVIDGQEYFKGTKKNWTSLKLYQMLLKFCSLKNTPQRKLILGKCRIKDGRWQPGYARSLNELCDSLLPNVNAIRSGLQGPEGAIPLKDNLRAKLRQAADGDSKMAAQLRNMREKHSRGKVNSGGKAEINSGEKGKGKRRALGEGQKRSVGYFKDVIRSKTGQTKNAGHAAMLALIHVDICSPNTWKKHPRGPFFSTGGLRFQGNAFCQKCLGNIFDLAVNLMQPEDLMPISEGQPGRDCEFFGSLMQITSGCYSPLAKKAKTTASGMANVIHDTVYTLTSKWQYMEWRPPDEDKDGVGKYLSRQNSTVFAKKKKTGFLSRLRSKGKAAFSGNEVAKNLLPLRMAHILSFKAIRCVKVKAGTERCTVQKACNVVAVEVFVKDLAGTFQQGTNKAVWRKGEKRPAFFDAYPEWNKAYPSLQSYGGVPCSAF